MKENKRVEIKQKPSGGLTRENLVNKLPKTMARQVWLKSKERVLPMPPTAGGEAMAITSKSTIVVDGPRYMHIVLKFASQWGRR